MKRKGHGRVTVRIPDPAGSGMTAEQEAIAPLIISASRSTDIPAFYGDWFMARLAAGYVKWKSPFGGSPVYVSFEKTRVFVFWSKNPEPFFCHLDTLDRLGCLYYFLITLNDYDAEGLESGAPLLDERIAAFTRLSERIGRGRVVWRYDPLILSDEISVRDMLGKVRCIGDRIHPFTERLVISFVDIEKYAKVQRNLRAGGFLSVREFSGTEIDMFCEGLSALNKKWGLKISACGEHRDLSRYGIARGQCISYDLMVKEFPGDRQLMEFIRARYRDLHRDDTDIPVAPRHLKDPGQRNTCGCIVSKDIGQYSTCMHLCAYCYANTSQKNVAGNYAGYLKDKENGIFYDSITG